MKANDIHTLTASQSNNHKTTPWANSFSTPPTLGETPINIEMLKAEAAAIIANTSQISASALIGSALYLSEGVNDVDFACLTKPDCGACDVASEFLTKGWEACTEYDGAGQTWFAIRKGHLNFMITHDPKFYDGYVRAMDVCKALALTNKEDRIMVCQIVRDGKSAADALLFRDVERMLK